VAYATEEIMRVLLLAGTAALTASLPIGGVLVVLLFVVGFSYRQTIKAYPTGGGSYIVAKDNLGTLPGLAAAGSLLTSYTLTVAVSVAAGVKALTSGYPQLDPISAEIGVAVVVLITLINLRGIRESGSVFMLPTYVFLVCMAALLGWGLFRYGFGSGQPHGHRARHSRRGPRSRDRRVPTSSRSAAIGWRSRSASSCWASHRRSCCGPSVAAVRA